MNVILLALIAIAVRYGVMLKQGTAWFDEAFSLHFSSMPFMEMLEFLSHDVHPPLYAILLSGWMKIFGADLISARWLSFLLGIALVPLMMHLAKRFGRSTALAAGAVTAFSPIIIFHSSEARMYPLLLLLITIATDAYLRMLDGKKKSGIVWGVSIGMALLTHVTAIIPFGLMCFYGWFFLKERMYYVKIAILSAIPAVIWVGFFTIRRIGFGGSEWQIASPSNGSALNRFLDLFVHGVDSWIRALVLPLLFIFIFAALVKIKKHINMSFIVQDEGTIATRFLLISALVPFLVFLPVHTSTTKYLFVAFPAIVILVSIGIKRLFGGKGTKKVILIYLLIVSTPVIALMSERRILYDDAMAFIEVEEISGDIIYASWFASELLIRKYYNGSSQIYSTYTYDPALNFEDRLVRHAGQLTYLEGDPLEDMITVAMEAPHVFIVTGEINLLNQPVLKWYFENGWRLVGEYQSNTLSPIVLQLENPKIKTFE